MSALLRAAYAYLRIAAFRDLRLPTRIRLVRRRTGRAHGYYYSRPDRIVIGDHLEGVELLRVMAHEMCHLALEHRGDASHRDHGSGYRALARTICERMGWPIKGFV